MKATSTTLSMIAALLLLIGPMTAEPLQSAAATFTLHLVPTTQGPFWPPSAIADENGDFIAVGRLLLEVAPGVVGLVPGAALVSRETVPPLGPDGRENYRNPFGAPYKIVRMLDMSPGSPDLDLVLYTNSFGPLEGDFGGGPRIPRAGESTYNLNSVTHACPEVFPSASQMTSFHLPRFPLHRYPIYGFQGDQVIYDPNTGEAIPTPEDLIVDRRRDPITLGQYTGGSIDVTVTLIDYRPEVQAFTAARFDYKMRNLLPNAMYHLTFIRNNVLRPNPLAQRPSGVSLPIVTITDEHGDADVSRVAPNPFPDPVTDDQGIRVIGLNVAYRFNGQNTGVCAGVIGSGVDVGAAYSSQGSGVFKITDLITKADPGQEP